MWHYLLDNPDKNINLLDLFDDFDSILDRSISIFSSSLQDMYGMNIKQKTKDIYLSALDTAHKDIELIQSELRNLEN